MTNQSGRKHLRTKIRAQLKIAHPAFGEAIVSIENLSDGGIFIPACDQAFPEVGEILNVQVQDLPVDAPVLKAKIVRSNKEGIGLMFVED